MNAWQDTLRKRFQNAADAPSRLEPARTRFTITLARADLFLVSANRIDERRARMIAWLPSAGDEPSTLVAHGSHSPPQVVVPRAGKVYAEVRYDAWLLVTEGGTVHRAAGTVRSRQPTSKTESLPDVVQSAVVRMFEYMIPNLLAATGTMGPHL